MNLVLHQWFTGNGTYEETQKCYDEVRAGLQGKEMLSEIEREYDQASQINELKERNEAIDGNSPAHPYRSRTVTLIKLPHDSPMKGNEFRFPRWRDS
ncbi:MAG: hypothetical protein GF344_01410 [Chitinivibrionales bacterium]|nr:hypothetical protein [Chitinivibrionales bacterium]